ncbi:hypothetical protein BH11PLA1_BH11PLA1_02170 [soil metagenome]
MLVKQWSYGDKIVHLDRPEWGAGVISAALPDKHDGRACQRVTVRFERAGVKTLSTAIANLIPAEDAPRLQVAEMTSSEDPLMGPSAAAAAKEVMTRLPDAATDPFVTPQTRLKAAFQLYRYSDQGAGLLDWAATQSGLKDPMTRFSRHELEDLYRRFCNARDEQLRKILTELRRADPLSVASLLKAAPKGVQQVLKRFDTRR